MEEYKPKNYKVLLIEEQKLLHKQGRFYIRTLYNTEDIKWEEVSSFDKDIDSVALEKDYQDSLQKGKVVDYSK